MASLEEDMPDSTLESVFDNLPAAKCESSSDDDDNASSLDEFNISTPHRIMFISVSRWLLDLFFDLIAFESHPDIMAPGEDYHMFPAAYNLAACLNLLDRPASQCPEAEKIDKPQSRTSSYSKAAASIGNLPADTCPGADTTLWDFFTITPHIEYASDPAVPLIGPGTIFGIAKGESHFHFTFSALNKTILPDQYIRTWEPVFLIQNSVLLLPKVFRELRESFNRGGIAPGAFSSMYRLQMSFRYMRMVYDWCLEQSIRDHKAPPVILRTENLLAKPEEGEVWKFCERFGLDTSRIRHWIEEFGQASAVRIEQSMRAAMEDYDYVNDRV
ncbi:hypothetical protein BJX70DRAFT_403403 [Aspergillus crustosus]